MRVPVSDWIFRRSSPFRPNSRMASSGELSSISCVRSTSEPLCDQAAPRLREADVAGPEGFPSGGLQLLFDWRHLLNPVYGLALADEVTVAASLRFQRERIVIQVNDMLA